MASILNIPNASRGFYRQQKESLPMEDRLRVALHVLRRLGVTVQWRENHLHLPDQLAAVDTMERLDGSICYRLISDAIYTETPDIAMIAKLVKLL